MAYKVVRKTQYEIQQLHNLKKGVKGTYYLDQFGDYYEVLYDLRLERLPKLLGDIIAGKAIEGNNPTGPAGGDLTGNYPDPELITVITPGTYGGPSIIPELTIDKKGRVISAINRSLSNSPDVIIDGGTIISPTENVLIDGGSI